MIGPAVAERRLLEPHELAEQGPPEAIRLPLNLVDPSPSNPRRALQDVAALAESIRDPAIGLLQPILVRRMGDRYEVLSGHRRRAAFLALAEQEPLNAAWKTIPSVVRTAGDQDAFTLLLTSQTHIARWTPREEAAALETLAVDHTLAQIGALVHKNIDWVSTRLRVYADAVLSAYVQTGKLSAGVAQEFLIVKDAQQRRAFADQAVADQWTREHARAEVRKLRIDAQLRELGRRVQEMLELLSAIDATRIPIEAFRDLQVLRGRIEALSEQARGESTPRMPSIEEAERAAGVRRGQPDRKKRRTRLRID